MLWTIEQSNGQIRVTFNAHPLFTQGSSMLTQQAKESIHDLVAILPDVGSADIVVDVGSGEGKQGTLSLAATRTREVTRILKTFSRGDESVSTRVPGSPTAEGAP